jgi:hypothetical protein
MLGAKDEMLDGTVDERPAASGCYLIYLSNNDADLTEQRCHTSDLKQATAESLVSDSLEHANPIRHTRF